MTAKNNEVPQDTERVDALQRRAWVSENITGPADVIYAKYAKLVSHRLTVLYRRASTRAVGLVLNTIDGILEIVPGGG